MLYLFNFWNWYLFEVNFEKNLSLLHVTNSHKAGVSKFFWRSAKWYFAKGARWPTTSPAT